MSRTLCALLLTALLCSCGSSGTSSLGGVPLPQGNFISTTVDVERRFLYSLSLGESAISGFVFEAEDEDHDHHHGGEHSHRLAAQEHDHDEDHGAEHGGGEELALRPLDSSPYTLGGAPLVDMVVSGDGRYLLAIDRDGGLRIVAIDGFSGLLSPRSVVETGVANPRRLRLSSDGRAVAVLGDRLTIYALDEEGQVSLPSFFDSTSDWLDVQLDERRVVAVTDEGAYGMRWSPAALLSPGALLPLPGGHRGQVLLSELGVLVVNGEDRSLSRLSQADDGTLTLVETWELPAELVGPQTVAVLEDGEHLLVGDATSVVVLHLDQGELVEDDHRELEQAPTALFPIPDSNLVLVAHALGEGATVLSWGEEGLGSLGELDEGRQGVSAFGYLQRVVRVTQTVTL